LPSQISREAAKRGSNSSSKCIGKKRGQKNKKYFFGRMKKALIFALPIKKTGNKKALKIGIKQVRRLGLRSS
jgi:hypothetical protein